MITIIFWVISTAFALFLSFLITSVFSGFFVRHAAYGLWQFCIIVLTIVFLRIEYNYLPDHNPVYPTLSWNSIK